MDTQVFSHYYHQTCAFVILLHVHVCPHVCLVFGRVRLCGVCHTSKFENNTDLSSSFPEVLFVGVNAACTSEPFYCHSVMLPFYYSPFLENDLCFKLSVLVSKEGALHNRQIWPEAPRAAKLSVLSPQITLSWNNLEFCLRCSSFSPVFLFILS